RGASIGHVSPEAAEGGLIGLLQDGDEIFIDVDNYVLEAKLSDEEIEQRRQNFVPLKKPLHSRWLGQYRSLVTNAASGAVLKADM
ncbi:MAG: dihydroxy-acid dehydratase, partial [Campylobacterota bacterium]